MRDQKRFIPSPMKLHFSYDESLKALQKPKETTQTEQRERRTKKEAISERTD